MSRSLRWAFVESLLSAGFSVAAMVILARYLSPAEFGAAAVAMAAAAIVQTALLGGMADALNRTRSVHSALTDAFFWRVSALGLAAAGLTICGGFLAELLTGVSGVAALTAALSIGVWLFALSAAPAGMLLRKMRTGALAARTFWGKLAGLGVTVLLAAAGHGPWALVLGQVANQAVSCAQLWSSAPRRPKLAFHDPELPALMRIGLMAGVQQFLNILTTRGFILAYGAAFGAYHTGLFNFALRLVEESGMLIMNTLRRVGVALFAAAKRNQLDVARMFTGGTRMIVAISAPLFLGGAAIAPDALPWLFGEAWRPAVPVTQLLLVMWLLRSTRLLAPPLLLAEGHARPLVTNALIGLAVTVVAFLAAAPFGPGWGALAFTATLAGTLPAGLLALKQKTGVSIGAQTGAALPPVLLALIMCAAVGAVRLALPAEPAGVRIVICASLGLILYPLLLLTFDRATFLRIMKTIRR